MTATAHGVTLLRQMIRIRRFEERCAELYKEEKIRGFLHLYIGEEAIAVGVMQALTPEDAVVATYREHGHAGARHRQEPRDVRCLEGHGRVVDAVDRCTYSTRRHASSGGTPLSADTCRWPPAWPWLTGCRDTAW
jgi:hypothetical protein